MTCDETQFQCLSGDRPCIPAEFENDGDEDCSDGSDENGRRVPIIQPIPVGRYVLYFTRVWLGYTQSHPLINANLKAYNETPIAIGPSIKYVSIFEGEGYLKC